MPEYDAEEMRKRLFELVGRAQGNVLKPARRQSRKMTDQAKSTASQGHDAFNIESTFPTPLRAF